MGNDFSFEISYSLSIKNIIFDAIDSTLDPSYEGLQYKSKCGELSGNTLIPNEFNPQAPSEGQVYSYQSENGLSTIGGSLFQFQYLFNGSLDNTAGTLNLESGAFQNFFYDFTSLIGFIYDHGKVNIVNSSFDKFSNGGSIIRNTRELASTSNLNYSNIDSRVRLRGILTTENTLKQSYHQSIDNPGISSYGSLISIRSSTFSNFNYLKSNVTNLLKLSASSEMRYQGIILNLKDYFGNIIVKNNTFDSLQFKFDSGSIIYETSPDLSDYLWSLADVFQGKTLFYIDGQSNVEFIQNTFTRCNSVIGLIYIVKNSDDYGVLIHNNTFESSSALLGSNNIRIDVLQSKTYNDTLDSTMAGAGVQISNNYFHQNIGGLNTLGNILSMGGSNTELEDNINNDKSYSEPEKFPMETTEVIIKESVSSFDTMLSLALNEGEVEIDLNLFLLKDNTYLENFIPNLKGIVNFYNIYKVTIDGDIFQDNGFLYKEALNMYGSIYSNDSNTEGSGAFKFSGYFLRNSGVSKSKKIDSQIYYSGPPVYIQGALDINILNTIFDNNYLVEVQLNYDDFTILKPAQTISIVYSKGNITIENMVYQNYNGIDLNKVKTVLSESEYAHIHTASPEERSYGDYYGVDNNISVSDPDYYLPYSTFVIGINLYDHTIYYLPELKNETDYPNFIDNFVMTNFTTFNLTSYKYCYGETQYIAIMPNVDNVIINGFEYANITGHYGEYSFFINNLLDFTLLNVNVSNTNTL